MLIRAIFLFLLVCNLAVGAWLIMLPRDQHADLPATDPGVAKLVLLSERDQATDHALALSEAPRPAENDAAKMRCLSIGPFPQQNDMRAAFNLLGPLVDRIRSRQASLKQSRGWLVFLPAPATREEALAVARQIYDRGVRDYYVVTAGNQQNTISLGLFKDRNNAEHRRAEIAQLGFAPAITERVEQIPVYWLDLSVPAGSDFDWRNKLLDAPDIEERDIACSH